MYQNSYLVEQVEVLLSQFEWNSRDSPTETRLTDGTDSLSFLTPTNFPHAVTVYTTTAGQTNHVRFSACSTEKQAHALQEHQESLNIFFTMRI